MEISLDPYSEVPLYQQLRDQIVLGIAEGRLARGETLGSVRRLGAAFAVNPATIAKGYDLLRSEGLVATNAKSGTFIARDAATGPPPPTYLERWRPRLRSLLGEAIAQGVAPDELRRACDDALSSFESSFESSVESSVEHD